MSPDQQERLPRSRVRSRGHPDPAGLAEAPVTRHVHTGPDAPSSGEGRRRGRRIISVIGIDRYAQLTRLQNAVADAKGVRDLFVNEFGFEELVPPLFDEEATREAIEDLVEDRLRHELEPDDELILFFAGHGCTREDHIGGTEKSTGYIAPIDAVPGQWKSQLKIKNWLDSIDYLPARNVFVVLDACHSGLAMGDLMWTSREGETGYREYLSTRIGRKILTSARQDQVARDNGPVEGHSLFTGMLIRGLKTTESDFDGNELVTTRELALYLEQRVGQATGSGQTPGYGCFGSDGGGDLFIPVKNNAKVLRLRAVAAFERGDVEDLEAAVSEWVESNGETLDSLFWSYRLQFSRGALSSARDLLDRMLQMNADRIATGLRPGNLPMTWQQVGETRAKLGYWRDILSVDRHDPSLEVTLLIGEDPDNMVPTSLRCDPDGRTRHCCPAGLFYQLEVTNTSPLPRYVYLFVLDIGGDLNVQRIWETMTVALRPGDRKRSDLWRKDEQLGPFSLNLYSAHIRVGDLLTPPSIHTSLPVNHVPTQELASLQVQSMRCLGVAADQGHLAEAVHQAKVASLYEDATVAVRDGRWSQAVSALEQLEATEHEYQDAAALLDVARRHDRAEQMYAEAHRSFEAEAWQETIDIVQCLEDELPEFSDSDGLLLMAHERRAEAEELAAAKELYEEAHRAIEELRWDDARDLLERVGDTRPGHEDSEVLVALVEAALAQQRAAARAVLVVEDEIVTAPPVFELADEDELSTAREHEEVLDSAGADELVAEPRVTSLVGEITTASSEAEEAPTSKCSVLLEDSGELVVVPSTEPASEPASDRQRTSGISASPTLPVEGRSDRAFLVAMDMPLAGPEAKATSKWIPASATIAAVFVGSVFGAVLWPWGNVEPTQGSAVEKIEPPLRSEAADPEPSLLARDSGVNPVEIAEARLNLTITAGTAAQDPYNPYGDINLSLAAENPDRRSPHSGSTPVALDLPPSPWNLEPSGTVEGRVVVTSGKPLPDARVCAWLLDPRAPLDLRRKPKCTLADKKGRFTIEQLVPSEYDVSIIARGYIPLSLAEIEGKALVIMPGGRLQRTKIILEPGGAEIHGRVETTKGEPIQGARVATLGLARGVWTADVNGDVTLWAADEETEVVASAEGFGDVVLHAESSKQFHVELQQQVVMSGVVVMENTGERVPMIRVRAGSTGGKINPTVYTDDTGGFVIPALPPGRYSPLAWSEGLQGTLAEPLEIKEGYRADGLTITVWPIPLRQETDAIIDASDQEPASTTILESQGENPPLEIERKHTAAKPHIDIDGKARKRLAGSLRKCGEVGEIQVRSDFVLEDGSLFSPRISVSGAGEETLVIKQCVKQLVKGVAFPYRKEPSAFRTLRVTL